MRESNLLVNESSQKVWTPGTIEELVASCYNDPLSYTHSFYPWGEPGTELAMEEGPEEWQEEVLYHLGSKLQDGNNGLPIRVAVKSGHGAGKGALCAWLVQWFMDTRPNPQIVVTANTGDQLSSKTWREVAVWLNRLMTQDLYTWTATRYYRTEEMKTWYATAQTWNEENPQAMAGTHAEDVLVVFDESSEIPDCIWDTMEGALTTGRCIWVALGNPTKPTGKFMECFEEMKHRWKGYTVDTRTTRHSNKALLEEWITDYGEDSDFVRVRVKGTKPRQSVTQLLSEEALHAAEAKFAITTPNMYDGLPVVLGVDVAAQGDDDCCIAIRQGTYVHRIDSFSLSDHPTPVLELGRLTRDLARQYGAAMVFVDNIGIGRGTFEILLKLGWDNVIAVNNQEKAQEPKRFFNRRAETYWRMKTWIETTGALEHNPKLHKELIAHDYEYSKGRLRIEEKKTVKKKIKRSPDRADALALTFTEEVAMPDVFRHAFQEYTDMNYDHATLYDEYDYAQ